MASTRPTASTYVSASIGTLFLLHMSAILFKIQNKEIPPIGFIEAFGKKICLTLRTFQKAQEEPMQKRNS